MRYCHCVIWCNDFLPLQRQALTHSGVVRILSVSNFFVLDFVVDSLLQSGCPEIPRKAGTNSVTNIHTRLDSLHALRLFVSLLLFAQTHAFARRQVLEHHRFRLLTQLVQSLRLAPEDAERFKTHVNSTCTVHRKELTWLCGYFRIHS